MSKPLIVTYVPALGDRVVTVSLNRGEVVGISGDVLHIKHSDRYGADCVYFAASACVIRVQRDGMEWACQRRRSGVSILLPTETSFGNEEYLMYLRNSKKA